MPAEVEAEAWPELSYRLGVTDGLPTFPPSRDVVDALVDASGRPGDEVVGPVPPANRLATVEAIAANGAMAGCLPEHLPVVLAAIGAMLDPTFNLGGVQATTHACWPLVIVHGAAVDRLGMATRESVFNGGGARANVAIGRAVRLVLWNVGGARPREPVQEIFGHPGRFAYCIAEEQHENPWLVDHDPAVTVFACEAPHMANTWGVGDVPEHWLDVIADGMTSRGSNNTHTMGELLVVISPALARNLDRRGWTRGAVQAYLYDHARRRLGDIKVDDTPYAWWPGTVDQSDPDTMVPVADGPEAIHVVVAGGDSIPGAAVCPGWGHLGGHAVTRRLA